MAVGRKLVKKFALMRQHSRYVLKFRKMVSNLNVVKCTVCGKFKLGHTFCC